jgi:hypothetical protein
VNQRFSLLAALALTVAICSGLAGAQAPAPPASPVGELKSLGQDRYQVGRIVIDKRARSFAVPGRVHLLGQPLEYLATSPGGVKAYEALLEVDATGSEFNLACILIGLERDAKYAAARQAGPGPLLGPRVAIFVAWVEAGKRRQVSAAQAILNADVDTRPESVEWVYIGSPASEGQERFAADLTGTLVAFKPDDNSVIESAVGIGIGAYGSVRGSTLLPPVGSAVELVVQAATAAK